MSDPRTCPVEGCAEAIPAGRLMCRTHWSRVPRYLRRDVHRTWSRFLEERDARLKLMARRDYLLASSAAIRSVDAKLAAGRSGEETA